MRLAVVILGQAVRFVPVRISYECSVTVLLPARRATPADSTPMRREQLTSFPWAQNFVALSDCAKSRLFYLLFSLFLSFQ